jgi:hypothetical protein
MYSLYIIHILFQSILSYMCINSGHIYQFYWPIPNCWCLLSQRKVTLKLIFSHFLNVNSPDLTMNVNSYHVITTQPMDGQEGRGHSIWVILTNCGRRHWTNFRTSKRKCFVSAIPEPMWRTHISLKIGIHQLFGIGTSKWSHGWISMSIKKSLIHIALKYPPGAIGKWQAWNKVGPQVRWVH